MIRTRQLDSTRASNLSDGVHRIPVSILTGFLGSGKTTLLSALIRHPALGRAAVIINEFGEIGLDHDLVARGDETVVRLSTGCLCCTIRGNLAETLRDLVRRREDGEVDFDCVLVETTGLADPAPILYTLMSDDVVTRSCRPDTIVTTVDVVNAAGTLDSQLESVKQIALADRVFLTKSDLASAERTAAVRLRVQALNPGASIHIAGNGSATPDKFFGTALYDASSRSEEVQQWLREEAYVAAEHEHDIDVNRHDHRIRAFSVVQRTPMSLNAFNQFMTMLMANRGADMLRVKGLLNITELPTGPIVIQGAQHVFHPPLQLESWPSADRRTRMVFITRDVSRETIEKLLGALS